MQSQQHSLLEELPSELTQYLFTFFRPWEAKALPCVSQRFKVEFQAYQKYENDKLQQKMEKLVKEVNEYLQSNGGQNEFFIKVHAVRYKVNIPTIKLDDIVYFNQWEFLLSTTVNIKNGNKHLYCVIKTEDVQTMLRGGRCNIVNRVIPATKVETFIVTNTEKQRLYDIYMHAHMTFSNLFPEIRALQRLQFDEQAAISFGRFFLGKRNLICNEDFLMADAILDYLASQQVISYQANGLGYVILRLKQKSKDAGDIKILLDINLQILNPHKLLTACLQAQALYEYTNLLISDVESFFERSAAIEERLKYKVTEGGLPFILGYNKALQKGSICYLDDSKIKYYTLSANSVREVLLRSLVFLAERKLINIAACMDQVKTQTTSKPFSLR